MSVSSTQLNNNLMLYHIKKDIYFKFPKLENDVIFFYELFIDPQRFLKNLNRLIFFIFDDLLWLKVFLSQNSAQQS